MLQENAVTGLLFLVGIFYASLPMGIAALLATSCGTATAIVFKFDKENIDKGLYGFSASLVGVALLLFFKATFWVWLLLIVGSALATAIQQFFIKRRIPVFTLPFVLVTWLVLFLSKQYFPDLLAVPQSSLGSAYGSFAFAIKGFGQVIFQENIFSGLIFLVAVLINLPIAALYGLAGSAFSGILASQFSVPQESVSNGLFGFNAVLCAIVFAGSKFKDGIWALIAVLLSLAISLAMLEFSLPQLTFPFVAASCATLALKNYMSPSIQPK